MAKRELTEKKDFTATVTWAVRPLEGLHVRSHSILIHTYRPTKSKPKHLIVSALLSGYKKA
jgi:hypothetical protein